MKKLLFILFLLPLLCNAQIYFDIVSVKDSNAVINPIDDGTSSIISWSSNKLGGKYLLTGKYLTVPKDFSADAVRRGYYCLKINKEPVLDINGNVKSYGDISIIKTKKPTVSTAIIHD